jgi:hypothetical protein
MIDYNNTIKSEENRIRVVLKYEIRHALNLIQVLISLNQKHNKIKIQSKRKEEISYLRP